MADSRSRSGWSYWLPICLGGLLIGLMASFPLGVVWPYPIPPSATVCMNGSEQIRLYGLTLPFHCMVTFMFTQPLVWSSYLIAGGLFGLLAHSLTQRGSRIFLAGVGAIGFLFAGLVGSQFGDRLRLPGGIALHFAVTSFLVSFTFGIAIGLSLRTQGLFWRAIVGGVVTALAYFFTALVLYGSTQSTAVAKSLSVIWRPIGPMMVTVLISNLVAGTIGGASILFLFTSPPGAACDPAREKAANPVSSNG